MHILQVQFVQDHCLISVLNALTLLADFICWGSKFHIWLPLYVNDFRPYLCDLNFWQNQYIDLQCDHSPIPICDHIFQSQTPYISHITTTPSRITLNLPECCLTMSGKTKRKKAKNCHCLTKLMWSRSLRSLGVQRLLAEQFGVGKTQIQQTIKRKAEYMTAYEENTHSSRKRLCTRLNIWEKTGTAATRRLISVDYSTKRHSQWWRWGRWSWYLRFLPDNRLLHRSTLGEAAVHVLYPTWHSWHQYVIIWRPFTEGSHEN